MGKRYRPWNPNQEWLLPPSALDWLPGNDLVYFILDTAREPDISAISAKYEQEERGYPPYHPRMMVALLLYAYCRGIFSSRQIMEACQERISFRVLVSDDIPNFRTISDFRKLHLKELQQLFVQVLQLCQEAGLVKLAHVSLDGTKVKANASRHKAMSYGRMAKEEARLASEIEQMLAEAEAIDRQEDEQYGESSVQFAEDKNIDAYIATKRTKHSDPVLKTPRGRPPKDLSVQEKMARKLRTKKGREMYSRRKSIVEPVFGQIKGARGFVQFSLRGLEKMRGEWAMVCLTHNLLKLFRVQYALAA